MVALPRDRSQSVRKIVGAVLYAVFMLIGIVLLAWLFSAPTGRGVRCDIGLYGSFVAMGALFALPAVLAYMLVPLLIDRYDPEPWWALALAFFWGAVVATGFSAVLNTAAEMGAGLGVGKVGQAIVGGVISAPLVEELFKGIFILGVFVVLRSEFDGVVDGVIYATFCALGFACVENILYYSRAGWTQLNLSGCNEDKAISAVLATFFVRGIVSPWGHPLYTSMTGIGIGIARETTKTWLKVVGPIGGYMLAVLLHAVWNGSALASELLGVPILVLTILLYLVFVVIFTAVMVVLVVREGRIIRTNLSDEVLIGTLTPEELAVVCSPIGRIKAMFKWGPRKGPRFVRTAATLAIKKWHTARAMRGRKMTISADFVVPLRQQIAEIRATFPRPPARPYPVGYAPQYPQYPQQQYPPQQYPPQQYPPQQYPQQQYPQQQYPQQQQPQQQYPQQQYPQPGDPRFKKP